MAGPRRLNDLREVERPGRTESRANAKDPRRPAPITEKEGPVRQYVLMDNIEPRRRKSRADGSRPRQTTLRNDESESS